MRRKHYSYLFAATLLVAFVAACSGAGSGVPSNTTVQPARVSKNVYTPTVTAQNNSDIQEVVTQPTPYCWSPTGATIAPGHSQVFSPPADGCASGTLKANEGSTLNQDCALLWFGGLIHITNDSGTACNWTEGQNGGTWTYQLSSRKR